MLGSGQQKENCEELLEFRNSSFVFVPVSDTYCANGRKPEELICGCQIVRVEDFDAVSQASTLFHVMLPERMISRCLQIRRGLEQVLQCLDAALRSGMCPGHLNS